MAFASSIAAEASGVKLRRSPGVGREIQEVETTFALTIRDHGAELRGAQKRRALGGGGA